MKRFYALALLCAFIFCLSGFAREDWKLVDGLREIDMDNIAIDTRDDAVYVSSGKNLYRSGDKGNNWTLTFSAHEENGGIDFVGAFEQGIFICAGGRVFKSDDGLAWREYPMKMNSRKIIWVEFADNRIFAASEKGVYENSGAEWKRIFLTGGEEAERGAVITDENIKASGPINSMTVINDNIFLAGDFGIFASEDSGETWKEFVNAGLSSLKVRRLVHKDGFYAATGKGVFIFFEQEKLWKPLYKGLDTKDVRDIAVDKDGYLWAATKKGLYKIELSGIDRESSAIKDILKGFDNEPCVKETRDAAIEYAEVHPDKIKEWRAAAGKKALLPNVSIGLDRYAVDYWHWDSGTNPDTLRKGKDTVDWDITMTWDMGGFIWNDDQTSIDTRSKLMVELRQDITDQVTRIYFERRRLQAELLISEPKDLKAGIEKELRLQELTADIDALTGGYFSEHVRR
ncbi:MAG: hypothetical protein WC569_03155 [Candidatus Omnitrophota bacterium]